MVHNTSKLEHEWTGVLQRAVLELSQGNVPARILKNMVRRQLCMGSVSHARCKLGSGWASEVAQSGSEFLIGRFRGALLNLHPFSASIYVVRNVLAPIVHFGH